jgi:lipoprotein-releasing system permease protein
MSFELFVALRYLTARRKQAFISLISAVSILGVGVGVMALVIALALMTGLQRELRDRIVGSTAHVYVSKSIDGGFTDFGREAAAMQVEGVVAAAPAIIDKAVIEAGNGAKQFVSLKGVDVALEPTVTTINASMVGTAKLTALNRADPQADGIILGADLADNLRVSVGDSVEVTSPEGALSPLGRTLGWRRFVVVGTFRFGFYEFDAGYGLVTLDVAKGFLHRSGFDYIQIRARTLDDAPRVAAAISAKLGSGYKVDDWLRMNGSLYSALWLEKVAISLAIGLIVMVAALNIVASLVLLVMEKSRDIAILRTMGATSRSIRRIFIFQGLVIGCVGTVAGAMLGLVVCVVFDHYHLVQLPGDVYQITYLPFKVLPLDFLIVVVSAVAVCFLSTIYPSWQAGKLDPAEALRYQ